MVWGIPKNVIEEFNEKIIRPKYHSLGMVTEMRLARKSWVLYSCP